MLSKKITDGYVGVSINFEKTHVLLQVTKDKEQVRIKLTEQETFDLIEEITTNVNIIKSKKAAIIDEYDSKFPCKTTYCKTIYINDHVVVGILNFIKSKIKIDNTLSNEVYRLINALSDVVELDCLQTWFETPNDAFNGVTPLEIIEKGEINQIWDMIYILESGAHQ